jgi:hypothetical protein
MRSAAELTKLGIEMDFHGCPSAARACHHLSTEYDALLVHQVLLCDEIFACGPPVIILERIDGAQLAGSRPWIRQAAGVIKGYTFRDRQVNNKIRGRLFAHRLVANGIGGVANTRALYGLPEPHLSDKDLDKIHLGYGFPAYDDMESLVKTDVDWHAHREIDLHCVCWAEYKGTEIELHRKKAIEVARTCPGTLKVGEGRPYEKPRYERQLLQSKCVVSPWGWGEPCYRDVEAMIAGCVLIKPDTGYVESVPDLYSGTTFYRPCKPDFSDLPDIVADVMENWNDHHAMRYHAATTCRRAWLPESVAATIATAIGASLQ